MNSIPHYDDIRGNLPSIRNSIFIDAENGNDYYFVWGLIDKIVVRHSNASQDYTIFTLKKIESLRKEKPDYIGAIIPDCIYKEALELAGNVYREKN